MAAADLAARLFDELARRTRANRGVTRETYGPSEQVGHDLCAGVARDLGLEVTLDHAGNLYMTLPGSDRAAPRWITGSHLDSVPEGGNFDGAAGVVAGLAAVAALQRSGFRPRADVTVMGIRGEEASSWFGGAHGSHLGSRAALGLLPDAELDGAVRLSDGLTLRQAMRAAGFDPEAVTAPPPWLAAASVAGYVELHIEQGPVLEHEGLPVGIVTGIRGALRGRDCRCIGEYGHSGAVPRALRRDALLATVELIGSIEALWGELAGQGHDLVFTAGRVHTDAAQDSLTKVPGEVRFTIDLRSQEDALLADLDGRVRRLANEIAARRGVRFDLGRLALGHPGAIDPALRLRLVEGCQALGLPARELPSGAGHDAADFAHAGIPSAMIFVRNDRGSHNPDEAMRLEDFGRGVDLLAWFLSRSA